MMLELIDVTKKYRKSTTNQPALSNVRLNIEAGERILIIGSSGAGKTTLLNILGLVDQDFQGQYLIDSIDIKDLRDKEKARLRNEKFGLVFQEYELLEDETVYDNVVIPLLYSKHKRRAFNHLIDEILVQLDIIKYKKQKVKWLSGGERQRVAIARALVNKPSVIIADEPTGSLDEYNRSIVLQTIDNLLSEEDIFIFVTHQFELNASEQYRIIELEAGVLKQ